MPCLYPIPAVRTPNGTSIWPRPHERDQGQLMQVPCGTCLECQDNDRLGWALRCWLEWQTHQLGTFATLTYENAPIALSPEDLQRFHKRLRKALTKKGRKLRYFAAGEYGETNSRPHYHGLYFGLDPKTDYELLQKEWGLGFIRTDTINVARIHYIVGYTDKKRHDTPPREWEHFHGYAERLDKDTGEITKHIHKNWYLKPPFRVMSKNPGLGSNGKTWRSSWRTHAILEGRTIAVPRFLKQHWKDTATPQEIEQRDQEILERNRARTTKPRTWEESIEERDRAREARTEIHRAKNRARRNRKT